MGKIKKLPLCIGFGFIATSCNHWFNLPAKEVHCPAKSDTTGTGIRNGKKQEGYSCEPRRMGSETTQG